MRRSIRCRRIRTGWRSGLSDDPFTGLGQLSALYLAALLLAYAFEFTQTYLMQWTGQKVMFDLRREIFRHMQRMHIGFFDQHAVGRLVTRLTSDVDAINEMFTAGVLSMIDDLFALTIMVVVMLAMNWELALLTFVSAAADCVGDAAVSQERAGRATGGCAGRLRASTALPRSM